MKHIVLCIALMALGVNALADEDDFPLEYERQESLEIPGLTAGCHVCEWRPKLNQKPAPEQCGVDAAGKPLTGLFECGYSEDCERVCNFLGCGEG
ncbi:MAG: hypothetical protein AMJ66_01240 [Betaproteobacteria bacterium SG8_40]|jgi:hypothetical protein|nr:MAG: hypothetical protein AMJ66_01240 [Betaproteobacteria bacterium SG8_40]